MRAGKLVKQALEAYTGASVTMRNLGIYIFDQVEVLDFAGPFEVFSTASRVFKKVQLEAEPPFRVFTIGSPRVTARGGLVVEPEFRLTSHPKIDVLLIPGGVVTAELEKKDVIDWIAVQAKSAELTASVCTGAFLIGKAGLLKGRRATTHWEDVEDLRTFLPDTEIVEGMRWIDEGNLISSAGISAGLDMSFHIVSRLAGMELATRTARQMDYEWREET